MHDGVLDDVDLEGDGFSPWEYLDPPSNIHIKTHSSLDDDLLHASKIEMKEVARKVKASLMGKPPDVCNVANLFLRDLVMPLAVCINTALDPDNVISTDDVVEFIRTFAVLSVYRCSPTALWDNENGQTVYHLGIDRDERLFKKCIKSINKGRRPNGSDGCSSIWGEPFQEDETVRRLERAAGAINSQLCFVKDVSRLSIDDDQLRLSSSKVEDGGFVRVQIPNKAYGPVRKLISNHSTPLLKEAMQVSTNAVSLMTGITLVTRLSGREESKLQTIQIILRVIFGVEHHDRVRGRNIAALDRGYLQQTLILYLIACGLTVIGTHPRVKGFPFTFGSDRTETQRRGRRIVEEIGCKSIYWAQKKSRDGRGRIRALAYRMGNGRVATLLTTSVDVDMGSFLYVEKRSKSSDIVERDAEISRHLQDNVLELTSAQGGLDWHFQRAASGCITSTLLCQFLRVCQSDIAREDLRKLIEMIGISPTDAFEEQLTDERIRAMTVPDLKACLRHRGVSPSGPKSDLIELVRTSLPCRRDVKQEVFLKWFMKPLKRSTSMVIGNLNESRIVQALPEFFNNNECSWSIGAIVGVGLVCRKDRRDVADSPDGIVRLVPVDQGTADNVIAALEMKTAVERRTRNEAYARIEGVQIGKRILNVDFGSSLFRKMVWKPEYRAQVLQHAVGNSVQTVVFAVASRIEIIYVLLIKFTPAILDLHLRVTEVLCRLHLSWYRLPQANEVVFPDKFNFGHAVDQHTVRLWRSISNAISADRERRSRDPNLKPRKPAHDLVPELVAMWNKHKG